MRHDNTEKKLWQVSIFQFPDEKDGNIMFLAEAAHENVGKHDESGHGRCIIRLNNLNP